MSAAHLAAQGQPQVQALLAGQLPDLLGRAVAHRKLQLGQLKHMYKVTPILTNIQGDIPQYYTN